MSNLTLLFLISSISIGTDLRYLMKYIKFKAL